MLFLNNNKLFKKVRHKRMEYYVEPDFLCKLSDNGFDVISQDLIPLDIPEENRSVYLSEKLNAVIKKNKINKFRRRLYTHFNIHNFSGKYSLVDEYRNLSALSHVDFVPKVYAFGKCRKIPVEKECLVIEYYKDALTAEQMVRKYPDKRKIIIENVFELFLKAWNSGFAHMDPHPKNILFLSEKELKLIDFECCCLKPEDKDFYFGFSMGYFFHFWFNKYISEKEYDTYVLKFIAEYCLDINASVFHMYYEKFKVDKVSRRLRYKCFLSSRKRKELIGLAV